MTAFLSCKKETEAKKLDPVKIVMCATSRQLVAPGSAVFTIKMNVQAVVPGIFCGQSVQRASGATGTHAIAYVVERNGVIVTDGVTNGVLTPLSNMIEMRDGYVLPEFTDEKIALIVSLTTTVPGSYSVRAVQFRAAHIFGGAQNIPFPDSCKTAPLIL